MENVHEYTWPNVCCIAFLRYAIFLATYSVLTDRSEGSADQLCPLSVWPHLFCGAGHDKRREEQLKWALAFTLYTGSFPCARLPGPVHTARLGRVCFFLHI